jgi:hypothetical protein
MSTETSDEFMTAQLFAEEMGVHYRTVLSWLRNGLVPGAIERETPMGNYWQIPHEALQMEKPKPGPKPKQTTDDQVSRAMSAPAKASKKAAKKRGARAK